MSLEAGIDGKFMRQALREAQKAFERGEAPVGAVIVKDSAIIARGRNEREAKGDATLHAEMTAIRKACRRLGTWRLDGCSMYVTLEPCAMCAGAAVLARLDRIVFGAWDKKAGACGSVLHIPADKRLNHNPAVTSGIMEEECGRILTSFFRGLREGKRSGERKRRPVE